MKNSPSVPHDLKFQFHAGNVIPRGEWIWVFGSDLAGSHRKGYAKIAHVNFRARYGCGEGATGRAYAIPISDAHMQPLSLDQIAAGIARFIEHARAHPKESFFVNPVACDGAGFSDAQIEPLFAGAPGNCSLPIQWRAYTSKPATA